LSWPHPDLDTPAFIKSDVNPHTNGTWLDHATNKFKSVTICNDSICATYQYTGGGQFLQVSTKPVTSGGGGGGGFGGGSGGSGGYYEYVPVYNYVTVCVAGSCSSAWVIVGSERIFIRSNEPQYLLHVRFSGYFSLFQDIERQMTS
jgi:hypothetical protein